MRRNTTDMLARVSASLLHNTSTTSTAAANITTAKLPTGKRSHTNIPSAATAAATPPILTAPEAALLTPPFTYASSSPATTTSGNKNNNSIASFAALYNVHHHQPQNLPRRFLGGEACLLSMEEDEDYPQYHHPFAVGRKQPEGSWQSVLPDCEAAVKARALAETFLYTTTTTTPTATATAITAPILSSSSGIDNYADILPGLPRLGYACENMRLKREHKVYSSRSCKLNTFHVQGLARISQLALNNCLDLLPLIAWNHANGIRFFRITSKLFPWSSYYHLEQLPDYEAIAGTLAAAGRLARSLGQRLTAHPPHFVKLATRDQEVLRKSEMDLEVHAATFDLMGFTPSHENKINIHVGGVYGCKRMAMRRFERRFDKMSPSLKARLTVENDDRPNSYSVEDLKYLHSISGIPLVFDFHHHKFCDGGQTQEEAFLDALVTWPQGIRPVVHWSETPECPNKRKTHPHSHSSFVYGPIDLYGRESEVDVMIESKAKEAALLMYRDDIFPGIQPALLAARR